MSSKPYDDACKTLIYECPVLLVPIINRMFHEQWPLDTFVDLHPNEFFKHDDDMAARFPDSVFSIGRRIYHLECQTDADGNIVIRIVEYDLLIAARTIRVENGAVRAKFPRSAVLGLRHGAVSSEPYRVEIEMPDGSTCRYTIPTLRMQDVTDDEIFDEDLYFLIPFVLFRHERELEKIASDTAKLGELDRELDALKQRFTQCAESGRIDPKSARTVIALLEYVSESLAKRYPTITERVRDMGGEVLELPALREWKAAEARGMQRGRQEGRQEGMLGTLFGLVRDGILTAQAAADRAKISLAAFNAKMAEYDTMAQA